MADVRPIDANALMDTIRQHEYQLAAQRGTIDYGMFTIGIQQAVDEQPTINPNDLRPQGRWVDKPTGAYGRWQSWCSVCGKHSGIGGIESNRHKTYCPNCGAKMDGKENEDVCTTCRFYPPSSCDGKPCTACGHGNPCYQRKENEDA